MKGVVLAGGLGTRLYPLTKITNKHLLPVYDKPMIYYPIQCLVNAGIDDILIVTGGNSAGDFLQLLGNGADFGLRRISYAYQQGEGGIADALKLAENFAEGESICVVLGDNIIEGNIKQAADDFRAQDGGAKLLLKQVPDPERFGVATVDDGKITSIIEKPKQPETNLAVIGIYMYDPSVFEICTSLRPSSRGELEITDVNNEYMRRGSLTCEVLNGWWTDAGTFESLHRAAQLIRENGCNRLDL
ncbi:MAG: sugar phosphate nucleotidyltransferase [Planctomycetota bacterium]|nr:sugar phosphate nucleotidyltransferase [Planctomycetota bacterium]